MRIVQTVFKGGRAWQGLVYESEVRNRYPEFSWSTPVSTTDLNSRWGVDVLITWRPMKDSDRVGPDCELIPEPPFEPLAEMEL